VHAVEPPPSYDSIFGQVKAARAESSSILDFFKKFLTILLGTSKYAWVRNECLGQLCNRQIMQLDTTVAFQYIEAIGCAIRTVNYTNTHGLL